MKPTVHLSLSALALVLVPAVGHAGDRLAAAAASGAACGAVGSFTLVQRAIVDKASQGAVPLIEYVQRTRMIHQLDLAETIAWLDERRASVAACRTAAGSD